MPKFNISYTSKGLINPNNVPKGFVEGQILEYASETCVRARNEKHARKIAFEGWKPESKWDYDRTIVSVELIDRPIVS